MELDIFDVCRFNFPALTINDSGGAYFNSFCTPFMGLSERWTMAKDKNGNYYICFLPLLSETRGYKFQTRKNQTTIKGLLIKFPDIGGRYKICFDEVKSVNNLDWFPLEKIEEINNN